MCVKPMEKQGFWGVQMLFRLCYFSCFASWTRVAKKSKTTSGHFLCVVVALTFIFCVSRGWFRFLTFKCPEVGLGFSLFDDTITLMRPSLDCLSKSFEDDNILRFSETLVQTSEGTHWEQPGLRKELIQPSSSTRFNTSVVLFFLFVNKTSTTTQTITTTMTTMTQPLDTSCVCCRRLDVDVFCVQRLG